MKAQEFKHTLTRIKSQLKGLTIQFVDGKSCTPYESLKEFGAAVLKAEEKGLDFKINQVWTSNGVKSISTVKDLVEVLDAGIVQAVSFSTFYQAKDFSDYLKTSLGTTV